LRAARKERKGRESARHDVVARLLFGPRTAYEGEDRERTLTIPLQKVLPLLILRLVPPILLEERFARLFLCLLTIPILVVASLRLGRLGGSLLAFLPCGDLLGRGRWSGWSGLDRRGGFALVGSTGVARGGGLGLVLLGLKLGLDGRNRMLVRVEMSKA
jgi:hypothetical protein